MAFEFKPIATPLRFVAAESLPTAIPLLAFPAVTPPATANELLPLASDFCPNEIAAAPLALAPLFINTLIGFPLASFW